jgi:hypothetical protein
MENHLLRIPIQVELYIFQNTINNGVLSYIRTMIVFCQLFVTSMSLFLLIQPAVVIVCQYQKGKGLGVVIANALFVIFQFIPLSFSNSCNVEEQVCLWIL